MALTFSSHNLPTDRAIGMLKVSKEAESLLGSIFKNQRNFGFDPFGD